MSSTTSQGISGEGRARTGAGGTVYADPAPVPSALAFRNVSLVFGNGTRALDGIDIDIRPGEFVSLVGPSGCGKSTLLRVAAGFDRPTDGTVETAGGTLGYVFQDATL